MTAKADPHSEHTLPWLPLPGFIQRLGIAQRIQVGFAIGAAVVVVVSLTAAVMVRLMSDTLTSMVDQVRLEQGTAGAMKDAVSDENQGVEGFLITGNPAFLDTLASAHQRFLAAAGLLNGPKTSAADHVTAVQVMALESQFQRLAQQEIALSRSGSSAAAADQWQSQGQPAAQQLREQLDLFVALSDKALTGSLASAHRKEETTRAIFAPIVMLVAGFGLFTSLLASRSIKRRFESLSATIARIEQGDFRVETADESHDELDALAISLRDMARALERESRESDRLLAEGARKNEELIALYDVARTVNETLDTDEILRLALNKLIAHSGADAGVALLQDPEDGLFKHAIVEGLSVDEIAAATQALDEDSVQATASRAMQQDGLTTVLMSEMGAGESPFQSALAVPLGIRGEGRGLLFLVAHHQVVLNADQQRLVEGLQKQLGVALERAWLYGQSRRLAATEERNRLARELHDSVTQSLFSMSMMAQALPSLIQRSPERADERAQRLGELARNALAEMRMLILELRPAALAELGLVAALERYVPGYGSREGFVATFRVEGVQRSLAREQDEALFRVAQEALSNVAHHAQAEHASVVLGFESNQVSLSVVDDGIGLPQDRAAGGFGLSTMRERAEQLGGTLTLDSGPGAGTRVTASIPAPAATASIAG